MRTFMKPEQLAAGRCHPLTVTHAYTDAQADDQLHVLPGWQREVRAISRTFRFSGWLETLAFVNAVGWMAHRQDHHPDLAVHFNHCIVRWHTHSVDGLSENDFVCAARTDALASDLTSGLTSELANDQATG